MNAVTAAITQLCESHHDRKQRWRAMKSVKWVLVSNTGLYAGLDGLRWLRSGTLLDLHLSKTAMAEQWSV